VPALWKRLKAIAACEWTESGWHLNPMIKHFLKRHELTSSLAEDKFFDKFGKYIRKKYRSIKTVNVNSIKKALDSLPLAIAAEDCTRKNPEGWTHFVQFLAFKDMQRVFGPATGNITSQMTVSDVGFVRTLAEKGRDGMYQGGGPKTVWGPDFLRTFNANCTSESEERKNATLREVDKQSFEARVAKATEVPAYRDEEDADDVDDVEVLDNTNGAVNDSPTRNLNNTPGDDEDEEDEEDDIGDSDGEESEDDVPPPSRKRAKINTNQAATSRRSLERDTRK
jgi:hypothetical protein